MTKEDIRDNLMKSGFTPDTNPDLFKYLFQEKPNKD